jgi:hypothetical protein
MPREQFAPLCPSATCCDFPESHGAFVCVDDAVKPLLKRGKFPLRIGPFRKGLLQAVGGAAEQRGCHYVTAIYFYSALNGSRMGSDPD